MNAKEQQETERREMAASILRSIRNTGCGELSPVEHALIGVLSTFFQNHIELVRKVAALERRRRWPLS